MLSLFGIAGLLLHLVPSGDVQTQNLNCLTCVIGGACSYASSPLNLSVLCYVPNQLLVSDLLPNVIKPAICRQLNALGQKLLESGKIQPWTALQVNMLY